MGLIILFGVRLNKLLYLKKEFKGGVSASIVLS